MKLQMTINLLTNPQQFASCYGRFIALLKLNAYICTVLKIKI